MLHHGTILSEQIIVSLPLPKEKHNCQHMIQNNLGAILLKQKKLKASFKIFIKQFQQQLQFIEQIIENGAEEYRNAANCCYCLLKRLSFFKKNTLNRFEMFNPVFFQVFQEMSFAKKQEYYLELLCFIEQLEQFYEGHISKRGFLECKMINKYKAKMEKKMVGKLINKTIMKNLEEEEHYRRSYEFKAILEGVVHRKICRFANWKLQMIEKVNGDETKLILDLRNYLILDFSKQQKWVSFNTIYETIKPTSFMLYFVEGKNILEVYERYFGIFAEMIKIGKIQKLVQNIDLAKMMLEGDPKNGNDRSNLMKTFLRVDDDQFSDHQNDFANSQDILRNSTIKKQTKVKKLETIRAQRYQEVKKRLIETLNFLSEKREKQNKRIEEFLNKQPISRPKKKSEAVLRVLKSTESFIPRKQEGRLKQEIISQQILHYAFELQKGQQCLSIINKNKQSLQHNEIHQKRDSFYADSKDKLSSEYEDFQQKFQICKSAPVIHYSRNIYKKMYKDYELTHVESLMDMVRIELSQKSYILPNRQILLECNNLTGKKLTIFKEAWLERIGKTVKLYNKKQSPKFIKIYISMPIEIKSLIEALLNIEAYPQWHPNVKKATIEEAITSENMIIFSMEILNPINNQLHSQRMLMHLFRFDGKYYIVIKKIEEASKENKGFFAFFTKRKSQQTYSTLDFLMIRVSNINKNGFCEIAISFDLKPVAEKYNELARKQSISFFLNYVFIKDYWKLTKQQQASSNLLSLQWLVSKKSFTSNDQEQPIFKQGTKEEFDELNEQLKLSLIQKQKKIPQSSSQQLIRDEFQQI